MIIRQENFLLHKNIPGDANSLAKGIVRTILEDNDGNLWFGLIDYGLVFYNRKEKLYSTYTKFRSEYYKHPKKHITALYQDSNNDIWLGEWDSGIYRLNGSTGIFEQKATDREGRNILTGTMIQKILEDRPGCLWIGTEFGLNYYNVKTNKNIQIVHDPENNNSLSGNSVQSNAVIKDKEGNLWVGVWSGGLNRISFPDSTIENAIYTSWRNDPTDPKSLPNDNVISLFYDEGNILWIGTFGGGLSKFDIKEGTFTHYTTADGLPNNIVYSVIKDRSGSLWLSTDGGLSRFDPENETFKNYYRSDGLQSDHFFWGSSHAGKSGRLYFGGIKGVNSFFPDSISEKEINTPVVLLSLKIFDKEYIISDSDTNIIELKYNDNFLTFEFAALNYINPHHVHYYYMTDGVDKHWIDNGNRRFANYTDLAPGEYTFKVRISETDIPDSNNEFTLNFVIYPPWWATWWARTFSLLIIIGSIIAFYYIRVGLLEKQKRKLKELVEKRTAEINRSRNELAKKNTTLKETLNKLEVAQNALVESEKMASIGIMSAGIAHEINNPLNFISVSTENIKMLIKKLENECTALEKEQLQVINKLIDHSETGIDRISNIIKSLKTYAHKGESKSQKIQIREIVESTLTILHSKIPESVQFDFEYNTVPDIFCKAEEISQVILNLIDNALDALSDNTVNEKKIGITVKKESFQGKNYILLSIFNSGHHIPEEVLKHIFDPFYTTKSPNKGTGLGLYISYNIIQDHGGILKAENISEGVKFLVYLPF
jgi:signal transduction histidine kinase/streptogramin lyase